MTSPSRTERDRGGFFTGVGYLARGVGMYGRHPGLMFLGLLPAVISFIALVGAFAAMIYFVDDIVIWMTPYLADWPAFPRDAIRFFATVSIGVLWVVLSVLAYVSLTLLIGQPFYEAISKRVEDRLGGVPGEINVSFWKSLPRTIGDSLRLGVLAVVVGIGLFLVGLIPVVGTATAIVLGAMLGGRVLALEVTSVPFERRGLRYRDRRRALKQHRSMSLGFGAVTFLSFLIPLGAIFFMPAAVAGATLLSRRILQPDA